METGEFQRLSSGAVRKIDVNYRIGRDVQLSLAQLLEELGELARAANLKKLRNKEPGKKELEGEFADVFMQLAVLADMLGIDIEKAVLEKIETLKKRQYL